VPESLSYWRRHSNKFHLQCQNVTNCRQKTFQPPNFKAVSHSKFHRTHISIITAAADRTVSHVSFVQVLLVLTVDSLQGINTALRDTRLEQLTAVTPGVWLIKKKGRCKLIHVISLSQICVAQRSLCCFSAQLAKGIWSAWV
jgi:hypothetical protein